VRQLPLSVADALKEARLAVSDGILLNDSEQPLDLADRVYAILELLLGSSSADARIRSALGGGTPRELLRNWFGRLTGQGNVSFWKYHFQMYRKRPVYWPLQSPGRKFAVWLFHERLTGDTLYSLRNAIVEPRIRLAERQIEDLRAPSERDRSARQELDRIAGWRTTSGRSPPISRPLPTGAILPTSTTASSSTPPPSGRFSLHGPRRRRRGSPLRGENATGPTRPWTTGRYG
jgi:hypothetical protein